LINDYNKLDEEEQVKYAEWPIEFKLEIEILIKKFEEEEITITSIRDEARKMLQTDHYNYLHNKFNTDKEFLEKFKLINGTKAALYYLLKEGDYFKKLVIDEFKIVTENCKKKFLSTINDKKFANKAMR